MLRAGLRGAYERAIKLCYGMSVLISVPLVIMPFYNVVLPLIQVGPGWACVCQCCCSQSYTMCRQRCCAAGE
jgi:hypothetical protein